MMDFINTLNLWDTNLFLLINGIHTSFFDGFMWAVSAKFTWIPLYISTLYVVIRHWKKEAIWVILALVLCVIISDQVSSGLIKNAVHRLRPSHVEELKGLVHLVKGYSGGSFGFVSSHAVNTVGFALLSSLLFKYKPYTLAIFSWAIITGYSRIYLGVHYPFDVLGGIVVGVLAALLCFVLLKKFFPVVFLAEDDIASESLKVKVPIWVLSLSLIAIIFYSIVIF
jgi:undecaprenyl-diphosphatase